MVIAVVVLSLVVLALALGFLRLSRNLRPSTLEDYAVDNAVTFVPVSRELVKELQTWSKPVRMRLDNHRHPLLAELICTTTLEDEPDAHL